MATNLEIFNISHKYWGENEVKFDESVVSRIYNEHMLKFGFSHKQIQSLEFTQYFEKYLWPNFVPDTYENEKEIIISICAIVNEKLSEKINPWDTFKNAEIHFSAFFQKILNLILMPVNFYANMSSSNLKKSILEQIILIQFLNNCFLALTEVQMIFDQLKYLLSLGMWSSLSDARLQEELSKNEEYKKKFKKLLKSDSKTEESVKFKRTFLPKLLDCFLEALEFCDTSKFDPIMIRYLENSLILFINLDSMLVSRRYLNAIIDDKHLIVRAQKSTLIEMSDNSKLFFQLLEMFDFYVNFEIDEITGSTLTDMELECRQQKKLQKLQICAFEKFKEPMRMLWISNFRVLENNETFVKYLNEQSLEDLCELASELQLIVSTQKEKYSKDDLIRIFSYTYKKRTSTLNRINNLALYPTEELIYDENQIPDGYFSTEDNFAIPKLSVQYLSFHDYLMRNFDLFRLEASYEIKQDIEQCLAMMKPVQSERGDVIFNGWSRMALGIDNFQIVEIGKPEISRQFPRFVRADVTAVVNTSDFIKREWENLARHDPCFLITVCPKVPFNHRYNNRELMATQCGLMFVRGCEIEGLLDADGKLIAEEERRTKIQQMSGLTRTWRVKLDPCQYYGDVVVDDSTTPDLYSSFNVFMRRKPKENNFKAVLDTIRDLMNEHTVVPHWLQDLLLGYDMPCNAHYSAMNSAYIERQDWADTFLSVDHLRASFPQYRVQQDQRAIDGPMFKLRFPAPLDDPSLIPISMHPNTQCSGSDQTVTSESLDTGSDGPVENVDEKLPTTTESKAVTMTTEPSGISSDTQAVISREPMLFDRVPKNPELPVIVVESYTPARKLGQKFIDPARHSSFNTLPETPLTTPGNLIPFTPTQIEAIRSGMQHGLTLVIGPPGTGKTDVAVQIINNLYRNYPNQRTIIVTHSNQALNQLFEKIMNLGIDERHLLRLGHGEEALETTKDFSKYGRVNYVLWKRLQLLREVERLSIAIGCLRDPDLDIEAAVARNPTDDPIYTCETAQHFLLLEVMPRWTEFQSLLDALPTSQYGPEFTPEQFVSAFPFMTFFIPAKFVSASTIRELFPGTDLQEDIGISQACFRHLLDMFIELDDFRSFELLRNGLSRANSLLVQHARIIAMTCTHAALRRRDLIQLGFTYDNILIEEAAQILEIETFIPLLLQKPDLSGLNRLKRWVMIGDHNQLPPVIKNPVFQNYCNMSQSMFARLVKLGVPAVQLNAQGRSRSSLRALYGWRYDVLEDLPVIQKAPEYARANPGLLYDYQLIDVPDYLGQGETEPTPHFIQNLAEAEYCVALYMYMRALGYPANRITILTTYNGQKSLIRDIVHKKCGGDLIGFPDKITTVDRFQGQQNDYIILSLVRTRNVGHLRDVRRLVVALSRARLGLYVFCRTGLFAQCRELGQAFGLLMQRRTDLALVNGEHYSMLGNDQFRPVGAPVDSGSVSHIDGLAHMAHYIQAIYASFQPAVPAASAGKRSASEALSDEDDEEKEQPDSKCIKLDDDVE